MALVQPLFPLLFESSHIFAGGSPIPGLWMSFQPGAAFFPPFREYLMWHGVGEPKRDKVCCVRLIPVRKMAMMFRNFCVFVKWHKATVWKTVGRVRLEA